MPSRLPSNRDQFGAPSFKIRVSYVPFTGDSAEISPQCFVYENSNDGVVRRLKMFGDTLRLFDMITSVTDIDWY